MESDQANLPERGLDASIKNTKPVLPGDHFAADLRGFGVIGILSIFLILLSGNLFIGGIIFIPMGGLFVVVWTLRSGTSWYELGFRPPQNWIVTIGVGLIFGFGFKLFMKAVLLPLLGASAMNPAYHFLSGNKAMFPIAIFFMLIAGISEEAVFRGFLFERLDKLLGRRFWARSLTVLITAALFALAHLPDQGLAGFEQAATVGLIFGIIYAVTSKIWILIFAHAAFDITAVAIIYWKLEWALAHFFFK